MQLEEDPPAGLTQVDVLKVHPWDCSAAQFEDCDMHVYERVPLTFAARVHVGLSAADTHCDDEVTSVAVV
jgi:hypothetical protein